MLGYLRNIQLSLLVISLTCPMPMAYANGDCDSDEKCRCYSTVVCPSMPVKKHKRHKRSKKHYRHIEKIENEPVEYGSKPQKRACGDTVVGNYCESIPPVRVNCKTINPSDLVDFTCDGFSDKVQSCTPYSCQAPYALDPTVKTTWQIHGKSGNRCIISNTTEDVGMKGDDEAPLPLTQMCEYDDMGIQGLLQRFSDVEKRYFHYSTCEHFEGVYNCTFKSGGVPIK